MPSKYAKYGLDYKGFQVLVTPEEHHSIKIRSAKHGVSVGAVCRLALADERLWKRAARLAEERRVKP